MELTADQLCKLIKGMRHAYAKGENAMAYARETMDELLKGGGGLNHPIATLVAYDLQAGRYVDRVRANPEYNKSWCDQLAGLIDSVLPVHGSILEVGVGEATTLAGVLRILGDKVQRALGFDISWSRVDVANKWLAQNFQSAELFVGDIFHIPLADNSVDVVYSSHSLEPNGGFEKEAIAECLRVSRNAVVLIEPIYELASPDAQYRMAHHGYVRGLKDTAERMGAEVLAYRLLEITGNPLNPSGVLLLSKNKELQRLKQENSGEKMHKWQCPLTGAVMNKTKDAYIVPDVGIAYLVLQGIPLLRSEHAIIASNLAI